jgi:hypothetical protein
MGNLNELLLKYLGAQLIIILLNVVKKSARDKYRICLKE